VIAQVVVVGNLKGGVGKTTLAINFAIARAQVGQDVLLVDGDEQGTAQAFTQLRAEALDGPPGYTSVSLQGPAIRTQVRQLKHKYQDIIIDVGGRDTGSFRAALTIADVLVVPVQPRSFDIRALDSVARLVNEAREINDTLCVLTILNSADPQGTDNEEAAAHIREISGFELLKPVIGRRKVFANAAAAGLSVLEYRPKDSKAIEELTLCTKLVFKSRSDIGKLSNGYRKES
jgi:chromosome partitioning protein